MAQASQSDFLLTPTGEKTERFRFALRENQHKKQLIKLVSGSCMFGHGLCLFPHDLCLLPCGGRLLCFVKDFSHSFAYAIFVSFTAGVDKR